MNPCQYLGKQTAEGSCDDLMAHLDLFVGRVCVSVDASVSALSVYLPKGVCVRMCLRVHSVTVTQFLSEVSAYRGHTGSNSCGFATCMSW